MLTYPQKAAFKALQHGFIYLRPLPVTWDLEKSQLVISNKASRNWLAYGLMMTLNFLMCIACCYVVLSHFFIQCRENYDVLIIAIHLSGALVALTAIMASFIFYKETEIIYGMNQIIILKQRLYSRKLFDTLLLIKIYFQH